MRVTRSSASSSGSASPIKRQLEAPLTPAKLKRIKSEVVSASNEPLSVLSPVPSRAHFPSYPLPSKLTSQFNLSATATASTADADLAQVISASTALAEAEGVLLHPALTFKFSDAKAHLEAVDPRWGVLIDQLKCKMFDGEQTTEFEPFKSLVSSIIGQQVISTPTPPLPFPFPALFSYPHATSTSTGVAPPSPSASTEAEEVYPFPTPAQILSLGDSMTTTLRSAGLSGRKVEYVVELARRFHDGRLDARKLWEMRDEEVRKCLLDEYGLSRYVFLPSKSTLHLADTLPPTQMFLIFSMKRPDILPVGDLGIQKNLCKWYSADPSLTPSIHPRKLLQSKSKVEERASTPPLQLQEEPVTPVGKGRNGMEAYPTPSSPVKEAEVVVKVKQEEEARKIERVKEMVFPPTSNNLDAKAMKARLGKKLKGNIYLSPKEMEELTEEWRPFRSVAMCKGVIMAVSPKESFTYGEYKQEDEQIENPSDNVALKRPARVFTEAEEKALYRKLLLQEPSLVSVIQSETRPKSDALAQGIATVIAGCIAFWAISDFPSTASFLTEEERAWVVWRKRSDGSSVGEAEGISWKYIGQALGSWQVWLSTAYYMSIVTPLYGVGLFLPTIIKSFGKYTTPQVQLLTVPVYVFACAWVVISAKLSDIHRKRFIFVYTNQWMALIGFIINISPAPPGVKYFGLFFCAAGAYGGLPAVVTWLGNNLSGQTKRGVVGLFTAPLYAWLLSRENAKKEKELAFQASLPDNEKRIYTVQELHELGDKYAFWQAVFHVNGTDHSLFFVFSRAPEFQYTI
ncbi:hypothetical protein P7C70_g5443, partial [Phenoliferia sp. Uapishka_3]